MLAIALAAVSFSAGAAMQTLDSRALISGEGFELNEISYIDDKGINRSVELYYIHSAKGVENAYLYGGLPASEKEELQAEIAEDEIQWLAPNVALTDGDFESSDTNRPGADSFDAWVINKEAASITNEKEAQLYIKKMGLENDVDEQLSELYGDGSYMTQGQNLAGVGLLGRCSGWRNKSKSFSKAIDKTYSLDKDFGSSGARLKAKADVAVDADVDVKVDYKYKRKFCIPYKFRLRAMDADVDYDVDGSFSLIGSVQKSFGDQSWRVAEPTLLTKVFTVGPIPVLVRVKLPIHVGTGKIKLTASGTVSAMKPIHYAGNFHYNCSTHSCIKKSASHRNLNRSLSNSLGGALSASMELDPYVQVAARGIVYGNWFFYMQIGAKPSFPIKLYGYYGNTCGDGNNDGRNETVKAGLGTLDFKVGLTAESKVFGGYILKPKYWKLWQTGLYLIDFVKPHSTAMSPLLRPAYRYGEKTVTLPVSIRNCMNSVTKYHPRDYRINWGDGSYSSLKDIKSSKTASHSYSNYGSYQITVEESSGAATSVAVQLDNVW